jgi:hypothetical protein
MRTLTEGDNLQGDINALNVLIDDLLQGPHQDSENDLLLGAARGVLSERQEALDRLTGD